MTIECYCIYANSKNTPSVRSGSEMGGYLKSQCKFCKDLEKSTIPPLRMDAYYYSFEPTGNLAIDKILSAVAWAEKAFHGTSDWNEEILSKDYPSGQNGNSAAEWIQNAANEAAEALK